ncbi:MAG: DNA repair protein RecN [Bacteroidota bacterium]
MISQISIENYALIRKLEISFSSGFNVITGETGAGKSIIVGAMSMLLGQRADLSVLSDPTKKCVVEGVFNISELNLESLFKEYDLDYDSTLIIRREITPQAKSRAFINDTPVTLIVLKIFAERLIDVHSQHHSLLLNESEFQLNLVDQFASNHKILQAYSSLFQQYIALKSSLNLLLETEKKAATDKDYYSFLFAEIEDVNPKIKEIESLEAELKLLSNGELIKNALYRTHSIIIEHDFAIVNQLSEIKTLMASTQLLHLPSAELRARIESCNIELKDIANEAITIADDTRIDPERVDFVTQRLDQLNKLLLKHRVSSAEELIELRNQFDEKLNSILVLDSEIEAQTKQLKAIENELTITSKELTISRSKHLKPMATEIKSVLMQLGMPDAELVINISSKNSFTKNGCDDVEILFSANKGQQPREIVKIASGGEISRLMLAVKSLIHSRNLIPIAIFDEIDTGVSGDIAAKVANILRKMSQNMQILAITHLPQIAAKAESHFWVYKKVQDDNTLSNIKQLTHVERVDEIAKMISGESVSKAAIETAEDLLRN